MIYRLKGNIIEKHTSGVVIDVVGVAYEATVSLATFSLLPAEGSEAVLYTHMSVREDGVFLYGFASLDEKKIFLLLTTVSGIGPKMAVKILSGIGSAELKSAISAGDHSILSSVPGVGKKTAERIVVELKDKFDGFSLTGSSSGGGVLDDVASALVNLGYKLPDCRKAMEGVSADTDFQSALKAALSNLASKK